MTGSDGIGRFTIKLRGVCSHCGVSGLCVQYQRRPALTPYRRGAVSLILKPGVRQLGVQCGCYGRAMRQLGYIGKEPHV